MKSLKITFCRVDEWIHKMRCFNTKNRDVPPIWDYLIWITDPVFHTNFSRIGQTVIYRAIAA